MRTLVSSAVMQLLSRGQRSLREELHAFDAGPEPGECGVAVFGHLVDGLDDQADPLLLVQAQLTRRLEHAARRQLLLPVDDNYFCRRRASEWSAAGDRS